MEIGKINKLKVSVLVWNTVNKELKLIVKAERIALSRDTIMTKTTQPIFINKDLWN